LGRLLLRLADSYGSRKDYELRLSLSLSLKLSQKDLGTLVGASREKVNRQLRIWEQDGTLAREGGYVLIRKPDALVADES
jgi:CRP-like cAMP-binding protein